MWLSLWSVSTYIRLVWGFYVLPYGNSLYGYRGESLNIELTGLSERRASVGQRQDLRQEL